METGHFIVNKTVRKKQPLLNNKVAAANKNENKLLRLVKVIWKNSKYMNFNTLHELDKVICK